MSKLTALQYLGLAKETTWGTGVAPTKYVPYDDFSAEDVMDSVVDEARRGNLTKDYNVIRTTKKSELSLDMPLYTNEVGFFLSQILTSVTTTGTGPYTHTMKVGNTTKSLTIQHYNGINELRYAGCIVDEVSIKGDTSGVITVSVKMQGKFGASTTTSTATIDTALKPLVGYGAQLTVDSVANTNLVSWEITLKRENNLVFGANNTQDPTKAVQGRISAEFKLTFDVEDNTEYSKFTDGTVHTFVLTFNGTASSSLAFTFTAAHVEKASFDNGEESLRVDWEGRGVYNSTDGGPCSLTLVNTTAGTAY